jgi:2-oxo-4-hydroxy-4-carboxy-5-ureidoimidazoline decarboxylase
MIGIDQLNRLPRAEFVSALRPLFEAADPLADALFAARPFRSYLDLLDRSADLLARLSEAEQIEVLNAHPRIGANPADVSKSSYREQGYERESAVAHDELARTYAELERLNTAYEDKFGFRFVVFVNGRSKSEILDVLRQRLHGTPDDERRTALREMLAIARDRLGRLSTGA